MKINEQNLNITVCQRDFGVPIFFEIIPDEGVSIVGETYVLVFDDKISDRTEVAESEDFKMRFVISKEEADTMFSDDIVNPYKIPYSLKRYKNGEYLDTLVNANLIVTRTVQWK